MAKIGRDKRPNLSDKEIVFTDSLMVNPWAMLPGNTGGGYNEVDDDGDEGAPMENAPVLAAPRNLRVRNQKLVELSDGRLTVEVLLEFDSVPGATEYNFEYTRTD